MPNNDNYFRKFNEFQENLLKEVQKVHEKLNRVDELYMKTVKSFDEDSEKIKYQDFINIFVKFIVDYETEMRHYLDKKEEEEEMIKEQNMHKGEIEKLKRLELEETKAQQPEQPYNIESLSQRCIINNMFKNINQSAILNDNAASNDTIIKNILSRRSERIKRLLNKQYK